MHLALAVPDGWEVRSLENGRRVVAVPPAPGLTIDIEPLAPAADEPQAWVAAAMARDLPAGATLRMVARDGRQSETGWPMELVHAEVVDASGAAVEIRLGAFYKLGEWAGHALVRATRADRLEAARAQLVEILAGARPRWRSRDDVTCLADLWA
jgi:hypothetical protein